MTYNVDRFETIISTEEMLKKYYDYSLTFEKCKACDLFASTWSCPGFAFDPKDFWKNYSEFILIVDRVSNENCASISDAQDRLFSEKKRYDAEMLSKENEHPESTSLAAQECNYCKKCARLIGKPCVHPESMRYALESLGMIAVNLVRDKFGFDILWSDGESIPKYYLLVGGILLK